MFVRWSELERLRRPGDPTPLPDRAVSRASAWTGRRVLGVWKVCVSSAGRVGPDRVKLIKSTAIDDYDAAVASAIGAWKFKPNRIGGVATEVCSVFTLIYSPR